MKTSSSWRGLPEQSSYHGRTPHTRIGTRLVPAPQNVPVSASIAEVDIALAAFPGFAEVQRLTEDNWLALQSSRR